MVNGGVQYRQQYAPPAFRPQMGAVRDLSVKDWALLGGGAIVAAAGISGAIAALPSRKHRAVNVVGLVVGTVVTLVGGTAFVDSFNRLTA